MELIVFSQFGGETPNFLLLKPIQTVINSCCQRMRMMDIRLGLSSFVVFFVFPGPLQIVWAILPTFYEMVPEQLARLILNRHSRRRWNHPREHMVSTAAAASVDEHILPTSAWKIHRNIYPSTSHDRRAGHHSARGVIPGSGNRTETGHVCIVGAANKYACPGASRDHSAQNKLRGPTQGTRPLSRGFFVTLGESIETTDLTQNLI